jgi:hypothetical protein
MIAKAYVRFDKLKGETGKAVLLQIGYTEYWFPKKLCFNFILNKKLGGNMSIPTWLYENIFGQSPSEDEATEIVVKHIPNKIDAVKIDPNADLIR